MSHLSKGERMSYKLSLMNFAINCSKSHWYVSFTTFLNFPFFSAILATLNHNYIQGKIKTLNMSQEGGRGDFSVLCSVIWMVDDYLSSNIRGLSRLLDIWLKKITCKFSLEKWTSCFQSLILVEMKRSWGRFHKLSPLLPRENCGAERPDRQIGGGARNRLHGGLDYRWLKKTKKQ